MSRQRKVPFWATWMRNNIFTQKDWCVIVPVVLCFAQSTIPAWSATDQWHRPVVAAIVLLPAILNANWSVGFIGLLLVGVAANVAIESFAGNPLVQQVSAQGVFYSASFWGAYSMLFVSLLCSRKRLIAERRGSDGA